MDLLDGTELGKILDEKAASVRAATVAAERKAREDALEKAVRFAMGDQLDAIDEREEPDATRHKRYVAHVKTFVAWTRERGLGDLPQRGSTVAAYFYDLLTTEGASVAELQEIADAITFFHDVGEYFIDRRPIAAALDFAKAVHALMDDPDGGGGTRLNGHGSNGADVEEALPLAAAGREN
jgi:hypothetical protein